MRVDPSQFVADARLADNSAGCPRTTADVLVEQQLQTLTQLAAIGMSIAGAAQEAALANGADNHAPPPQGSFRTDPALAYARVARAVRLTLMLQTRLLEERPKLERAERSAGDAREHARRERAHRIAVRAIRCEHDDDIETVERLSDEAWERLRDEDLSEDVSGRPVGEVVGRICADLGLSLDWTAWAVAAAAGGEAPPHEPRSAASSRAAGALRILATAPSPLRRRGAKPGAGPMARQNSADTPLAALSASALE